MFTIPQTMPDTANHYPKSGNSNVGFGSLPSINSNQIYSNHQEAPNSSRGEMHPGSYYPNHLTNPPPQNNAPVYGSSYSSNSFENYSNEQQPYSQSRFNTAPEYIGMENFHHDYSQQLQSNPVASNYSSSYKDSHFKSQLTNSEMSKSIKREEIPDQSLHKWQISPQKWQGYNQNGDTSVSKISSQESLPPMQSQSKWATNSSQQYQSQPLSLMNSYYDNNTAIETSQPLSSSGQNHPSSLGSEVTGNYSYPMDNLEFSMLGHSSNHVNPFQNYVLNQNMNGYDNNLMKNILVPNNSSNSTNIISNGNKRGVNELNNVLPMVMTGQRPYSPNSQLPDHISGISKSLFMGLQHGQASRLGPLCSSQPIRIPSHLLLTLEQRTEMEKVKVIKRVFDLDDAVTSHQFLQQYGLQLEQLALPYNKWKTRNTRKRKNATTHLYQCCCGSDVKQFHGTKGTRRSKQKFPFVACLAFAEVARRTSDGALIWVRGLLDHSKECVDAVPFGSQ